MLPYIARRLLLIVPTLLGILLINFFIIQAAPGGPVERSIARLQGLDGDAAVRITGSQSGDISSASKSPYRGAQGLSEDIVKDIERQYGFDKPLAERLWIMLKSYAQLDFGSSFYRSATVIELIKEKLPVSVSLGLWSTLLIYLISIPLGIRKAVHNGSSFDAWTSTVITVGYAIPSFLFAIILIVLFAGGSYWQWFPMQGLTSDNFDSLSLGGKIWDYTQHMILPTLCITIGGFATLTMLTKNSFLDEISKQYVMTARAKGLTEKQVLYGHVFRNAMLIIIAGLPSALVSIFFAGAFIIEIIFNLDGLGLLGYEAVVNRDYPVVFGTLFIFTLIGLLLKIISDVTYMIIDPRIDFEGRGL